MQRGRVKGETEDHDLVLHGLRKIPEPDYIIHPAYGKLFGKPKLSARIEALKRFLPYFFRIVTAPRIRRHLPPHSPITVNGTDHFPLLQGLLFDGVIAVRLSADQITKISQGVSIYSTVLEARRAQIPAGKRAHQDNVLGIPQKEAPELYACLYEVLVSHDILTMASRYLGLPVRIRGVFLQINDANDTFWRNHFSDIGLPDPATAYMHVDSSIGWMKCLIYLSHVNESNGPFSYVIGSNNLKAGLTDYIVRKANDKSRLDKCDRRTREVFWALPKVLRKKAEFGNDLLDLTPEVSSLIARERQFTSEDGNLIFFDNDGIHRGGMILEGKRHILQIQLETKP